MLSQHATACLMHSLVLSWVSVAAEKPGETAISESGILLARPLNNRLISKSRGALVLFKKRSAWPAKKWGRRKRGSEGEKRVERLFLKSAVARRRAA